MSHAPKRLASTAAKLAHVSVSHLKMLPPKEVLSSSRSSQQSTSGSKPHFFNAETWAALQPPNPATLTAFAHRIGLGNILTSPPVIQQACTHPSFLILHEKHYPDRPLPNANNNLAILGNSLLGLFASEYVNATYPYLPTRVMKAAVSAYVGPTTCATIAKEMGATPLLRWNRMVSPFNVSCNYVSYALRLRIAEYPDTASGVACRCYVFHPPCFNSVGISA